MAEGKIRVVALGGAGAMGRFAVQTAAGLPSVASILIADRDVERAKVLAERTGPTASFARVDVTQPKELADLLSGADAVLNTVGPFHRFGPRVLRAAIEAGCHYLDINDDWEPTLEMLALDGEARGAGITALIGMGASPGISNLLAVKAIRELDRAEEVTTGWSLDAAVAEPPEGGYSLDRLRAPGYEPSAANLHGVHQLTGRIRVWKRGRLVWERPIRKVKVEYPGLGTGRAWTIGHPEPVTLPLSFPDIRDSVNVFVCPRRTANEIRLIAWLVNLRLLSARRGAILFEKDEIKRRAWEKDPTDWRYEVVRGEVPLPPLFAVARGVRSGRPATAAAAVTAMPPGMMGGVTGVPLAVALSLVVEGKVTRRGVFAPEGGVDPDIFFEALAPHCKPEVRGGADLVRVTRSWEDAAI